MSTTPMLEPPAHSTNPLRKTRQRGRVGIVIALIVSLLASAGARYWTDSLRSRDIPHRGENAAGTSLSSMNSFALGLLLGGLRGPLVMFLWTQSESQKTEKNLEGFDTQIEWIRLLQPEFDTVHIFQIWNKAYNISVQMASLANKYSVILDALDYAHSVDREKPDDINILTAIGQIYFDKLGNSSEKLYYRRRVRSETLPHPITSHRTNDPGWRAVSMDPMLDEHGNLLPQLVEPAPGRARPADLPGGQEWNDSSEMQYLKAFEPFIDGISPYALAYDYYKRAEVLQNTYQQRHAQLSDLVIDSRPALALKSWEEEEWEQGRRRELQGLGIVAPDDRGALEMIAARLPLTGAIADRHAAELGVFAYRRAHAIAPVAVAEYIRHISLFPERQETYRSHMMDVQANSEMCAGDADYLDAVLAPAVAKPALLASGARHYQAAATMFQKILLTFYTIPQDLTLALPKGFGRLHTVDQPGVEDLSPQQATAALLKVEQKRGPTLGANDDDVQDYNSYMTRAAVRLQQITAYHP